MDGTERTTTVVLLLWLVLIVALERRFPYRKGLVLFRDGFWTDLVWYTLIQSYLMKLVIFDRIIAPAQRHFHLNGFHAVAAWPLAWQVLFFFVLHDFYIYWFHRWQHRSKVLWRIHEAHHSNKEVDWLAGSRSHALEILINQTVEFAPIVLLGAAPAMVPIKALLDAMFGTYIHANINIRTGRLARIVNSPEMHQWHHSDHKRVFHSNFATKLSLWDWLFGTAYLPAHKPAEFGLPYDYPDDYFLQHAYSVKRFDQRRVSRHRVLAWYRALVRLRTEVWSRAVGNMDLHRSAPSASSRH